MFAIYDYNGRTFRDTLENLYKVNPVGNSESSLRTYNDPLAINKDRNTQSYIPNAKAQQAYRELIHASPKEEMRHAYEILRPDFPRLKEWQPVSEVLNLVRESEESIFSILNENNRLVGVVDALSIMGSVCLPDKDFKSQLIKPVKNYVEGAVITAEPITSIRRIAQVMNDFNLRLVPIVDAYEDVVGVVTWREIAAAVANDPPLSVWT